MSHFTVAVITEEKPTEEHLAKILEPFNEATEEPEYIEWHSETDEIVKGFAENAEHREKYKTVERFAHEYHGCKGSDPERWGYFFNPNAKWDWWVIGGRWLGDLLPKPGVTDYLTGRSGVGGNEPGLDGGVDSLKIENIDFDMMLKGQQDNYAKYWDNTFEKREKDPENYRPWGEDPLETPRDEYIATAPALITFAILDKNGEWIQRGQMGWWGMHTNDTEDWESQYKGWLAQLNPDDWLTILDCHI